MSRAKYIIPNIMGEPGRELYIVRGDIPKGQKLILAKKLYSRVVTDNDQKYIDKLVGLSDRRPERVQGLETLTDETSTKITAREAALIYGYVSNTLPGAFKAPELANWYIYERPGDITPLKLARFSINLLSADERKLLLTIIDQVRAGTKVSELAEYS